MQKGFLTFFSSDRTELIVYLHRKFKEMKNLTDIEEKKKEIVEKYGMFMEKHENFPPIAARIFSTLLLAENRGATFEELVSFLSASKSTVSTNLQKLTKMEIVEYFTKPGDRKKYFTSSPIGFIAFLDEDLKKFKAEKVLVEEVLEFKTSANRIIKDPTQKFEHVEKNAFLDYLENSIKGLEVLKEQLNQNVLITKNNIHLLSRLIALLFSSFISNFNSLKMY